MRLTETELNTILAKGVVKTSGVLPTAAKKKRKGRGKSEFQSLAEERYFSLYVQPLMLAKQIVSCEMHESFPIVEQVKLGNTSFRERVYTPDFVLHFADGRTKVVEVKGTKVRKLQRDYPLRRQLFILKYCIPNNWEFEEVNAEELTKK